MLVLEFAIPIGLADQSDVALEPVQGCSAVLEGWVLPQPMLLRQLEAQIEVMAEFAAVLEILRPYALEPQESLQVKLQSLTYQVESRPGGEATKGLVEDFRSVQEFLAQLGKPMRVAIAQRPCLRHH